MTEDEETIDDCVHEFAEQTGGHPYDCPMCAEEYDEYYDPCTEAD